MQKELKKLLTSSGLSPNEILTHEQQQHLLLPLLSELTDLFAEGTMVSYWRQAGLNYLQYSAICARALRRCLKPELRMDAMKREDSEMKVIKWAEGKPTGEPQKIKFTS